MIRKLVVLLALAGLFGVWAFGDILFPSAPVPAGQAKVGDGDTLTIAGKDIRIYGVDAPEYAQICQSSKGERWPCGKVARQKLVSIIGDQRVSCEGKAVDAYGRTVATCSTPSVPDIGLAIVESGLAENGVDGREGPYAVSESLAQVEKTGIWSGPFVSPADWRKANPREDAARPKSEGTS